MSKFEARAGLQGIKVYESERDAENKARKTRNSQVVE